MTKNIKALVTGGCSFSQPYNTDITWVHHLEDYIQPEVVKHRGLGASGNGMISRRVISAVNTLLETYQPHEILVGVMWSEFKRRDYYSVDELDHFKIGFTQDSYCNPASGYAGDEFNWYIMNPHWEDDLTTRFKQNFYNYEDSMINCFEHILRTQWFLESKKVPFFFTQFDYSAFDEYPFNRRWWVNPEIKYLWDQIDKTKWLPIENCFQWCKYESGKDFARPPDPHPSTEQHKELTNRVIVPFLLENKLVYDIIV